MEWIVARYGGFCFGVRRAVDLLEECLGTQSAQLVQTLGPIIHNPTVVDAFAQRGVCVTDIDGVKPGIVVIRSHGVGRQTLRHLQGIHGVQVLDATCPHVARSQRLVAQYSGTHQVIIIGQADHPEVVGLCGWGNAIVVEDEEAVAKLPDTVFARPVVVLSQTTITRAHYDCVLWLLQERAGGRTSAGQAEAQCTICDATTERQTEAVSIARRVDAMLVVGGRNSSNTCKLFELCSAVCPETYHIETIHDLPADFIDRHRHHSIGITAGASTPDGMMKEVTTSMSDLENKDTIEQPEAVGETTIVEETAVEEVVAEPVVEAVAEAEAPAAEAVEEAAPEAEETQEPVGESMTSMEDYEKTMVSIRSGQIVKGTIVQVTDKELSVNIGYKSDGMIPRAELLLDDDVVLKDAFKVGDEIEAQVIKLNDGEGNVLLSKKALDSKKNWSVVEQAFEDGVIVEGKGKEVVKGGMIADVQGIRAFIPASQVSTHYVEDLNTYIGQAMQLKIIELDRSKRRVVASQKQVLMEEADKKKDEIWAQIVVGEHRKGTVRRLTDFGAFVDIGGIDGLVHVSDLSWGHVRHPSQVVKAGEEIEVIVLSADKEKNRISLGYKQAQAQPWDDVENKYPIGAIFEGTVVRIAPFGAFIELEPGVDGLVHISQLAHERVNKVEDVLQVGQVVHAKVLNVSEEQRRISLSIRDAEFTLGGDVIDAGDEDGADEAEADEVVAEVVSEEVAEAEAVVEEAAEVVEEE